MASTTNKSAVLTEWKKAYAQAVIEHLKPKGNILEIGFGHGFGAEMISKSNPKTHVIIESNLQIYENAKQWAAAHPSVKLVQGSWQTQLTSLGKFDAIYFHDYPQVEQDMLLMNFLSPENGRQTTEDAKKLIDQLESEISKVKVQFTNKDIEDFFKRASPSHSEQLPTFFKKLKENGNITEKQYQDYIKHIEKSDKKRGYQDVLLECLEICLKNNMNKGSRFSAFLNYPTSKYDDSQFFDRIITRSDIDYKEDQIAIKTSDRTREAIIMIVEKTS